MSETEQKAAPSYGRAPTVSVIIPAYNTASYIADTLDSVYAQTYKDFEVIVINDGSPDSDTLEQVLAPYGGRVLYLKQENRGLAGARNTGIRHARGEYLAFLDSDDCWLPDYLASQLKLFEETPSLDVVYSNAEHFGDPALNGKTYMQTCPSNGPVTLESLIREDCQVLVSCSVARKQVVVDAGLFDESLRCVEDYDLWLRILHRGGKIAYRKKVLGRFRSRPDSLSKDRMKMLETLVGVYEKAERTLEVSAETRAVLRKKLAKEQANLELARGKRSLSAGDFDRARESLKRADVFWRSAKLKLAILAIKIAPRWARSALLASQKSGLGS